MATTKSEDLLPLKGAAVFDFEAAVHRTYADFPELRRTLIVYDGEDEQFYADGGIFETLRGTKLQDEDGKVWDTIELVRDQGRKGSAIQPLKIGLNVFIRRPGDAAPRWFDSGASDTIRETHVTEHEIGHVVTGKREYREMPGTGIDSPDIEGDADGFATLRLFAQFGKAALPFLDEWSLTRTMDFISRRSVEHWTSPVMDKIMLRLEDAKFVSLTPREMAAIAQQHAKEFTPPDRDLVEAMEQLAPVKGKLRALFKGDTEPLKQLAEIITAPDANPYTVYAGAKILREFLKPGGATMDNGKEKQHIELTGAYWDDMAVRISDALAQIPEDHILRELQLNRLDITGRTPAPPQPVALVEYAKGAFNRAAGGPAVYAISNIDLKQDGTADGAVMLSAAEILAVFAQPGTLEASHDTLVTRPMKEKLHGYVKDDPQYASPLSVLSNESALGISLHMIACQNATGEDTALYILSDNRRHLSLIVGDDEIGGALDRKLKACGISYVARSAAGAPQHIDAFLRDASRERYMGDRDIADAALLAFTCVLEVPERFQGTGPYTKPGISVGTIIAGMEPKPTLYSKLMKPAGPG